MNSTKWFTLTEFIGHLSKTGQVRADQTDKGWFISVIQPDPEEKLAEEKRTKRDRAERVSESYHCLHLWDCQKMARYLRLCHRGLTWASSTAQVHTTDALLAADACKPAGYSLLMGSISLCFRREMSARRS